MNVFQHGLRGLVLYAFIALLTISSFAQIKKTEKINLGNQDLKEQKLVEREPLVPPVIIKQEPEHDEETTAKKEELFSGFRFDEKETVKSVTEEITNSYYDTDLRQVLQDLAMSAQKTIMFSADVEGYVTCEMRDMSFEDALKMVLTGTGYSYIDRGEYVFVYTPETTSPSFLELSETKFIKLNYIQAATAKNLLHSKLQQYITTDTSLKTNEICVTAPPVIMERIESDIQLIDRRPRQIMLDVRIVVMESNNLFNMGIKWNWPQFSAGIFSNSDLHGAGGAPNPFPWGMQLGYTPGKDFTNSLNLALDLMEQNEQATVLANPQVMALDGEQSEIKVTKEEYFEILTRGYYTQSELEKVEAGTNLTITPRIGENGDITLKLAAEVSDVIARGANNLPVVTRRITNSNVRVEDGGTAAIAGLVDSRTRNTRQDVPGLGKVPIVGNAFRDKNSVEQSRQVAIFVTPRIIPDYEPMDDKPLVRNPAYIPLVGREFVERIKEILATRQNGQKNEKKKK